MTDSSGLRFIAHSSVLLEDDDGDLLMDPWFFGDVFNGCCSLLAPPDLGALNLSRLRHVWISHTHPDHLHIPTLRWVRGQVPGPLTAFVRRSPNPVVRDTMSDLGFDVVQLRAGRERRVTENLSLTMYTGNQDSSLVIRHRDRVILNQNDTVLDERTIRRLKRKFSKIDLWFFQFSYGGFYANADDRQGIAAVRQRFRDRLVRDHALLQPSVFVPIASFVRYVKHGNAFLNDEAVTPMELMDLHPDLPIQLPWSGEEIVWEGWGEANRVNEARWREVFGADVETKAPKLVDEARLREAGTRLVEDAPRGLGPPETHVAITETGQAAVFDFRQGRFDIIDRADPAKLALRLPSEELLFFCASPYGADVVYGGCLHVDSPDRWNWLRAYRSTLEPGERSTPWRRMRTLVASAESMIAGGRVRAARQRLLVALRRCWRRA